MHFTSQKAALVPLPTGHETGRGNMTIERAGRGGSKHPSIAQSSQQTSPGSSQASDRFVGAPQSRQCMCRVCGVCLLVKLFDAAGSLSMQGRRARPVV